MSKHALTAYNTFGVEAFAEKWVSIQEEVDIPPLLDQGKIPDLILGGGSNILFSGKPLQLVYKNDIKGISIVEEDSSSAIVEAGAGENWHSFVLWTIEHGLGGIENLSLIPGTVGAAPIQNIGAYGVELKDVFHSLDAYHLKSGRKQVFTSDEAQFAYRDSFFKQHKGEYIITKVRLKLQKQHTLHLTYGAIQQTLKEAQITHPTIRDVSDAVVSIRQSKLPDPAQIGNAGSFFKNPIIDKGHFQFLLNQYPKLVYYPAGDGHYKIPAGWLIDQAGFKGKRDGNVGCYKHQALVIVNHGGATGQEILDWASMIIDAVFDRYSIKLEMEVTVY